MAIVPMHKVFLAGMQKERGQILDTLQHMGVVQIDAFEASEQEKFQAYLSPASYAAELNRTEDALFQIKTAIDALSVYDTSKKPLFAAKRAISRQEWAELAERAPTILAQAKQISERLEAMRSLAAQQNQLENQTAQLAAYKRYELPLDAVGTKYTDFFAGSISALFSAGELKEKAQSLAAEIEVLGQDEENIYISAVCLKTDHEALQALLDERGFRTALQDGIKSTAAAELLRLEHLKQKLEDERAQLQLSLTNEVDSLTDFKAAYDYYKSQQDKILAQEKLAQTHAVFFLQGWLPTEKEEAVKTCMQKKFPTTVLEITEPDPEEEYPILLHNNRFAEPFELVTELYSLPDSHEVDPNAVMSVFYFVFFGMMLSDAGYGIVLALITGFLLAKYKPEGTMGKLMKMIFLGGISTIFWGVMFGGWFGDLLSGIPAFAPLWFNPLENPMKLLLWSFVFGGVHLVAGMAMKAWLLIRKGHWLDAVFDIGLWYVLFAGLILWFVGFGPAVTLIGAVGLVLTQGRHEKNIFKKFATGLLSLYDITSYLSDILSYSRLLALGLATGVIGQVVNTMAKLGGNNVLGIIMFVLVLLVGHTFNIAINTLGAYVHSSRLQYVEFFGKFYSGGGHAFTPFQTDSRYVAVQK